MLTSTVPGPPASPSQAGIRLLTVSGACTVTGALLAIPGVPDHHAYLAFLVIVIVAALGAPPVVATASAGLAWAVCTGFIANDYGALTTSPEDVMNLALYIGAAVLTSWCSNTDRHQTGPDLPRGTDDR